MRVMMLRPVQTVLTTLAIVAAALAAQEHVSGGQVHLDLQVTGRRLGELCGKESGRARHLERRLAARRRRRVAGARAERARHAGRRDLPHRTEGGTARAETARPWFEKANVEGVVVVRPVSADTRQTYTTEHLGESELRHALGLLRLRVGRCVCAGARCRRRRASSSKPRFTACRATNSCGRLSARRRIRATCARSSRSS